MKVKYDDWSKVSINDYYRIVDICEEEGLNEMEKNLKLCAVICDCSEDDIYNLSIPEAKELISHLKFMEEFKFNQNFTKGHLIINGDKYSICVNLQDMTIAQYMDFQEFWGKNDLRKYYGNILACFIIPYGHKYNEGYDAIELAEIFRDTINIRLANEILSFFVKGCLYSIKAIQTYSTWIVKKIAKRVKNKKKMEEIEKKIKEMEALFGSVL